MTGMPFRKIRHYTDAVEKGALPRPDFNVRGVAFKNINVILSKQSLLDTELAVKAMPSKGDTDGKKRTLANKGTKFVNFGGTVYDPNAKYEPGKYFKHYTTAREKFNVISGLDTTEPNWGWVDLPKNVSWAEAQASLAKEPKVEIKKYKRNTKTGEIIDKTGVEIKAATLGQTLSEMHPGNNLGHRAARAAGLVIDKLGKMRCPPGTPAANQFTDNMGSNCFEVSVGDIQDMLQNVSNLTNTGQGLSSAASSAIAANPTGTLASIRRQAASQLGLDDLPDEFDKAISALMDARTRMEAASDLRASLIDDLITQLGTSKSQFRNQDFFEALIKLQDAGLLHKDFNFHELLMTGDFDIPVFDDDGNVIGTAGDELWNVLAEINPVFAQDNSILETALSAHESAFLYSYLTSAHVGLTHSEAVAEVQKFLKESASGTPDAHYAEMVKRMWDDQRGFLGSFLQSHVEDPSQSAKIRLASRFYVGNGTHAESIPLGKGEHLIVHNPLNVINNPPPPEIAFDEALVFSVDPGQPGTPAEHAYAVARKVAQFQFLQAYASQYNADFVNAFGNGYQDRGSQIFWHEFSHTMQWDAIEEDLRASGKILSTMSNAEVANALRDSVLNEMSDYDISNVAGMTMEDLITSRLDLLAGVYSASHQQRVIDAYNNDGGFSAAVARERRIAHLETCAELYAMRKTGVISSSEVDDALEWMDRAQARPANWANPIPQPGSSLAPELQHLVNGGFPQSPTPSPAAVTPSVPKSVGTPRPGRGSTNARRIREGMEMDELFNRIDGIHGNSRSRRKNDLEQTAFIADFINSKFGKNDLEDLTNDEIIQLSDALKKESQRLAAIPEPTGADADADGIAGWKESQSTAKRMDRYAEDLQDLVDLKDEVERQMGPAGPYVKTDADGNPIKRPSAYAGKPGEAFKEITKAYENNDIDAAAYRQLAEDYKDDLTPDEYDRIMEETAFVVEPDDPDAFWAAVEADAKTEDGFNDEPGVAPSKPGGGPRRRLRKENQSSAEEPAAKTPYNVDPQTGEIIPSDTGLASRKYNTSARVHSTRLQRNATPQESRALNDTFDSSNPFGGLVGDDYSVSSAIQDSAERRRILTDAGITGGQNSSISSMTDNSVEKFIVPTIDLMEKNPTTADMQIEVELDDETLGKLSALNGGSDPITIEHDGFIDGTPSDRIYFPQKSNTGMREQNRSVVIHIPKGARALSRGGAKDEKAKVKLPPGKLQFDGVTADGKPIARVVEQRTGDEILQTIERKTQKMSEGLRSDEKREAAKLIDATRKAQQQRKDRGDANVKDIKSMGIAKRNESITGDIRNSGSSPFRPEVVAEREKEAFQSANSSLGTTLNLPAEERHSSYLDRSSETLKLMRGKDTAVRENMLPVSPAVKKALETYSDDELTDMTSTVSAMINAGVDRKLVIPISDIADISGNGIRRPKDSDSVEMMRDDVDMLAGFGSNVSNDSKPVRALVRHKDHERQSVDSLIKKNAVNGQADFYSESDAVNAVLRPEVSTRSGYGYKDFIDRDSSFVSMNKPDRQSVDLAIADSSKDSDKDEIKVSRMNSLLSAAISGDYSEIVGTKDNPSMQALIPGGVKPEEIDHIEYPLSKIKLDSASIDANDPVLGKNTVTGKLQKMGLTDSEIQAFFNMGGAVGGGATPSFATRLMQYRGAQQVKNDMRQQGFEKIKFTNPEGLDIMNPTTWQTRLNARKESPHELLKVLAGKEVDNYLKMSADKIKKNRVRKTA